MRRILLRPHIISPSGDDFNPWQIATQSMIPVFIPYLQTDTLTIHSPGLISHPQAAMTLRPPSAVTRARI